MKEMKKGKGRIIFVMLLVAAMLIGIPGSGMTADTANAATAYKADPAEQTFAQNMQKLDAAAQQYTGKISGSFTGANGKQWLAFMYIRQFNSEYTSSKWEIAGGKVDKKFVAYVQQQAPALHGYFSSTTDVNGMDVRHMAAAVSASMHKNTGSYILGMRGRQWNDLSGWAGDLQTFLLYTRNTVGTSASQSAYYNATVSNMGKAGTTYDMGDLNADADAANLAEAVASGKTISQAVEDYYINDGVNERYTNFIGNRNRAQLVSMAKEYTAVKYKTPIFIKRVWDIYKNAGVKKIDSRMTNGIAEGYADFLMSLAAGE